MDVIQPDPQGMAASTRPSSLATGTAVRRLADEHKLPHTTPEPTFTLGLDA